LPDKLAVQVAALEADPDAVLCYGRCLVMTAEGERTDQTYGESDQGRSGDVFGLFLERHVIMEPAAMVRRGVLDEVGRFDPELRAGKDTDLFLRIALRYPAVYIPEPLMYVRQHGGRRTNEAAALERSLHARSRSIGKLLVMLPPERESFRAKLSLLLVGARLKTLKLGLESLSWEALVAELEALPGEAAADQAEAQLAQGTASLLRHWGRLHPEQSDHLQVAGLRELVERLSAPAKRPAAHAARLNTALGLNSLRRGKVGEGLAWSCRGLRRNFIAWAGQIVWAIGKTYERKRA